MCSQSSSQDFALWASNSRKWGLWDSVLEAINLLRAASDMHKSHHCYCSTCPSSVAQTHRLLCWNTSGLHFVEDPEESAACSCLAHNYHLFLVWNVLLFFIHFLYLLDEKKLFIFLLNTTCLRILRQELGTQFWNCAEVTGTHYFIIICSLPGHALAGSQIRNKAGTSTHAFWSAIWATGIVIYILSAVSNAHSHILLLNILIAEVSASSLIQKLL